MDHIGGIMASVSGLPLGREWKDGWCMREVVGWLTARVQGHPFCKVKDARRRVEWLNVGHHGVQRPFQRLR
jgi:hypothetical protein